ncbi:MAG: AAA family ATPase [Solirubrobacterales bacterium]|nr:AAA family ATPase [Solirubrobacterales bacterium]
MTERPGGATMTGVGAGSEEVAVPFVGVRTKILVPAPRPRALRRPHVVSLVDRGLAAKMTLVCAPTGWGKTSVLAEWAASRRDARFAWVSLDPSDNDPLQFWRYVTAAIATVEPHQVQSAMRRLHSPVVSIADEVLPLLVNALSGLVKPLVLVLDDFQVVALRSIHEQLAYLVDRLPLDAHVAIATHTDRDLRLGRLRAMGDLVEVRGEELRFSDEEAAELLNRVHGLDLGPAELARVQGRTEGWVAGLNLAALSLQRPGDRARILGRLPADERYLVDYLWDEVVLAQSRTVRHFLMRTAILERFSAPLCDAVAGRDDSEEMLRELEQANLFVVPVDERRSWFRYHHLFRDLLLTQLERHAANMIPDLHRRASTWYAEHGFTREALDHAIAAGDVNYAADELDQHWLDLYSAGQATKLMEWIDRLPEEVILEHPGLALARAGIARATGRLDEVESWVQRAEAADPDAPAVGFASSVASGAALARALYRMAMGDVTGGLEWARRAVEIEHARGTTEPITALYFLGVVLFFDEPEQAEPLLSGYLATVPAGPADVRRYFAQALLAEVRVLRDDVEGGERLALAALELARSQQLEEHPPTQQVHVALGAALHARGDFEAAEEHFERGAALARRGGDRVENAHALVWLARARAEQGDFAGARTALGDAQSFTLGGSAHQRAVAALERQLEAAPRFRTSAESETLSETELRVLRLFPADLSYREIAGHLYVSLNTVRTHAQRIRRKLGVSTRAEAVTRARELGLI